MYKVLLVGALVLAGCAKPAPEEAPVPAGAATEVSGPGVVQAGAKDGNLVIVPDSESSETYCLVGEWAKKVKAGDRVQFRGDRSAVLMLVGEDCLKLELAELTPL